MVIYKPNFLSAIKHCGLILKLGWISKTILFDHQFEKTKLEKPKRKAGKPLHDIG